MTGETTYLRDPSEGVVEAATAPHVEHVERLEVSAYTVPTETPEADGTLAWRETTLVLVHVSACGARGSGLLLRRHRDRQSHRRASQACGPRRQLPEYP